MSESPDITSPNRKDRLTTLAQRLPVDSRRFVGLIVLATLLIAGWASERWAIDSARLSGDGEARQLARGNASLFDSELQKFRLLPTVLTEYPGVAALLRAPASDPAALNRQLETLAARTGAAAIYVIAPGGRTLAASNYRLPTSFVGQNYGFRPYFTDALSRGASELFALGTVSGRPGLFIARRVGRADAPLGVIVVKIEFDRIEAAWRAQEGDTFVSDRHGVVIVSSRPEWRFHRLRPLEPAERAEIGRTRQFDDFDLVPLPVDLSRADARFGGGRYRKAIRAVALEGAQLTALSPLEPALASARARSRLALVVLGVVIAGMVLWLVRQRERQTLMRTAQRELEAKVLERTAELRDVNAQLVEEGHKRQRSEERFRRSREELAQANRLATLGQIAAGVAHEINQPVAAIRTFSENAAALIGRGTPDKAAANLEQVVKLTDRIAQITGELRTFARRKTPDIAPVMLDGAIEAALLLVHHRIAAVGTDVAWDPVAARLPVAADRVRLEQVFVNLLQNALDAAADERVSRIGICVEQGDGRVQVRVADNGRGVPSAVRRKLFTPFATGREDGLGLGLAIARDILREFGGDLVLTASDRSGTTFTATLVPG